jgi:hypothetical protein
MAQLKIELDTENATSKNMGARGVSILTSSQVPGLLTSIPLTSDLTNAFIGTLGISNLVTRQASSYKSADIITARNTLQNSPNNCTVLATVGGLITCKTLALASGTVPFVSLVGTQPTGNLGNCKGGVTLQSLAWNLVRKAYLANKGCTNIILLTNPNSAMHAAERLVWGAAGFVTSYVGLNGANTASNMSWDFVGDGGSHAAQISSSANTGIVVSDDPFFMANRPTLINLANTWLGSDATKFIVYPSQIYSSWTDPTSGTIVTPNPRSTLIGPDLVQAFELLGILTNYLANNMNESFGFFPVGYSITEF